MSLSLMKMEKEGNIFQAQSYVLLISHSHETAVRFDEKLFHQGFEVVTASGKNSALNLLAEKNIDFIVIEADQINISVNKMVSALHAHACHVFIPVIIMASAEDENFLSECILAGCDDFIFKPFTSATLKARFSALEQLRELKQLYKNAINEQLIARQILAFALSERNIKFEEIKLFSKSKEIFNGDLFLTSKRPDGGLHILLADFTGHGLSAAIGALPVADVFSAMTNKGFELKDILENINNKLHTLLPVSMFMACSALKIQADFKLASVWNGGMPDIYLRDSQTGEIRTKIKSSHIPLGIDEAISSSFNLNVIDINCNDQFILYTDGLTEAENSDGDMFGYHHFEQCLKYNQEKKCINKKILSCFNQFCGEVEPNDDVTLVCIPCAKPMTEIKKSDRLNDIKITCNRDNKWL